MDAEIELPDRKKQKVVCEMETGKDEEDIISELPDNILHHILSFRSTERAVSTSILSKRWKDLWMSTNNLYFKYPYYYKYKQKSVNQFTQFVDRVLCYHSSNITTFSVASTIQSSLDDIRVQSWISAAVERQVQMIHLSIRLWVRVLSLPFCLCTSKVLKSLELSSTCYLELPSTVWLPCLKNLHLVDVKFVDDPSFNRLFSGLPNIEELEIDNCGWDNLKNVGISLPTLRWLRLVFGELLTRDQDVVLKVSAINLQNLDCHINLNINLIIDTMPLLDEAKIEFPCEYPYNEGAAQHAANLFGGICFAKSIKIIEEVVEYLQYFFKSDKINLVPKFVNLTSLELDSRVTSYTAVLVITILHNAPLLESFVIDKVYGGKWSRKPYPQCIEFSLKSCSILRFEGRQADILFVKFLIKAAKVLEKLKINVLHCQEDKLGDFKQMVEKLPRASKSCVIKFYDYK